MNLGYACINTELNSRKGDDRITTNRTMIKRTFQEKGLEYTSELVLQNVTDLFFADKFAREAFKYKCSDSIFSVAEDTANYLRNSNLKQGQFNFDNE